MEQTAIRCSQCGSRVSESESGSQLECPFCLATTLRVSEDARKPKKLKRNRTVDLSKFSIDVNGADLELWWKWNRFRALVAIPMSIIAGWIVWPHLKPLRNWINDGAVDLFGIAIGLAGLFFTVGMAHTALAFFFNRTSIAIKDRTLICSHGPLPYYFNQRIPLASLRTLEVYRKVTRDNDGKSEVEYQLHACTKDDRKLKLIIHEKTSDIPKAVKSVLDAHIQQLETGLTNTTPNANRKSDQRTRQTHKSYLLICPRCGDLIPPPRNIESPDCRSCGAEMTIPDEVWNSVGLHPPRYRVINHIPVTFVVSQRGQELTVTADWNREWALGTVITSLLVLTMCITGIVWAFQIENWNIHQVLEGWTVLLSIFCLIVGLGAAFVGYIALCQLFNRTVVKLDPSRLSVWNGPLPCKKSSQLAADKIKQISIHVSPQRYRECRTYCLDAISDYGGTLELFFDQAEIQGLETVERLLERRLVLADRIVEGELT